MTADAFRVGRREGPNHFVQKRPPILVSAVESFAAAAASKNRLSRNFRADQFSTFATLSANKRHRTLGLK